MYCQETKQSAESDSDVIQLLELSDRKFQITMTNMLNVFLEIKANKNFYDQKTNSGSQKL